MGRRVLCLGGGLERAWKNGRAPNVIHNHWWGLKELTSEDCPAAGTYAADPRRKDTRSRATRGLGHV